MTDNPERAAQLRQLHEALATMDVPPARKTATDDQDLRWLSRNMGIQNAAHPQFPAAAQALIALGCNWVVGFDRA